MVFTIGLGDTILQGRISGTSFFIVMIDLPDMAVRIMGIIDLCAIPVLIYSTLKMRKK